MIGFMPAIYPDELVYSWFCRYYAHSGHSAYIFAAGDLLYNRNTRADIEFINRVNEDFKDVILSMMPLDELILDHTMFPYYRFVEVSRLHNALELMASTGEDAHRHLPVQKGHPDMQPRYVRYCPLCAYEAKNAYGEAYWNRNALMRYMGVCAKHGCRLKATNIGISGKQSGRLYVADEKIDDMEPETVADGLELTFARYMAEVFQRPICFENDVPIGEFLRSRLVGTKYMSARGMQMQTSLLVDDIMGFYKEIQKQVSLGINAAGGSAFSPCITQKHHIQHILTGKCSDFYKICQLAFFLGIAVDELVNPEIPKMTQTMIFDSQVRELYAQGLGCYRIARKLGCSAATARHVNKPREKKPHDYSAARLGKQKMNWDQYDMDMLSEVQKAAEQIYGCEGQRPKRVTEFAVIKYLGWPDKRFNYMPKCRELVQRYHEEFPVYWAREIVWCYKHLSETMDKNDIRWRNIRDMTNMKKNNFIESFPYLHLFADQDTVDRIKDLVEF